MHVYTCITFFTHSSVNGHRGCLAIVNSTAMNIGACVFFFESELPLDICPGVGLQGHMAIFSFLRNLHTVLIVAVPIHSPTNSTKCSLYSILSPSVVTYRIFNHSHSDWYEVVSHCSFDLFFLIISDVEHAFICLWPSVCLLPY